MTYIAPDPQKVYTWNPEGELVDLGPFAVETWLAIADKDKEDE